MTRRQASPEAVAAAQWIKNKENGVHAVMPSKPVSDTEAWMAANPDKVERLPSPGDCFLDRSMVIYGE